MSLAPPERRPARPEAGPGPWPLGLVAGAVAALVLVPGHGAHGLWSQGEIGALQRAQAALGAALSGLERSPWLPDALRTQALALTGDPAAIRLPGAIATCLLVALAAGLARALGFSATIALLAGAFALAFPLSLTQGRLAVGDPVGELTSTAAALLLAAALASPRLARGLALAAAGAAALALAATASGLWLGVVLPLAAAALWGPAPSRMSERALSSGHGAGSMPEGAGSSAPSPAASADLSAPAASAGSASAPASPPAASADLSAPAASAGSASAPASPPAGSPDLSSAPAGPSSSPDLPSPASSDPSPAPAFALASAARVSPAPRDLSPPPSALQRPLRLVLVAGALAAAGVAGWLAYHQGDGYIPALGAAKDLALRERPHVRGFHAALEDCGYQLFPWLPLVLLGLLQPGRARWPALWFAVGLALVSASSLLYGARAVPLTAPAAVLAAAAFARLVSPRTPAAARRLALVLALAGCWIFAKDARRTPSRIGAALVPARGEHNYPAADLGAADLLAGLAGGAAVALVLSAMFSAPGPGGQGASRMSRRLYLLRTRLPPWLPAAVMVACLGRQAWSYGRDLLPRTSEQFSLLRPLSRWAAWAEAGALPPTIGVHRVTDPGLDLYGPAADRRVPLATRDALATALKQPTPAAALIRTSELAALHQTARAAGFPLYVLDASNRDVLLVANTLPPGETDVNPIRRVLFDEPPALAHQTLLRFDDLVEVIAWEWDEPVVRGRDVELRVVLRPLKAMPSGSKITVRLQQGRLSRVNPMPHDLVENIYPPQYWRPGDYLLHRFRVHVPTLEIVPGPHEVVIGMRRTESANYKITVPEGETGEHGVRVFAGPHEFAVVGELQVW
ncbi:Dolichyl-phosphate-mannose-protein mannosyltransferase [Nannocystis exedens]|uniref:Dolichyl-phosphate-mannose-protein mannosyltransferase n=1 Tax=Nannocystis exedens TaxID=54 RepID=A0A1I2A7R2_9BACT|nr:phospholipid carrier-dependent glycosyltransferase [Nannocystis exedens]SFE39759.1 Dolichyl-phosphate-mannose-protein mannosyltransferase [Nannocystis exedens]